MLNISRFSTLSVNIGCGTDHIPLLSSNLLALFLKHVYRPRADKAKFEKSHSLVHLDSSKQRAGNIIEKRLASYLTFKQKNFYVPVIDRTKP